MRRRVTAVLASLLDGLLYALVIGSALALGGVHVPVTAALAVVALLFTILVIGNRGRAPRVRALPLPFWALGLAASWALVQALPLGGLLGGLSNTPAELFALAGEPVARLAANGPRAAQTSLFFATAALSFAAAYHLFERPERLNRLTTALIASAAIVTTIACIQGSLGERALLFFYEPEMGPVRPGFQGTFVNPDHFGTFAALGAILALGRAEGLRAERVHHVYDMLAAGLVAGLVLSYSLTAFLAFGVGLFALFFTWRAQNLRVGNPFTSGLPALVLGVGLAGALYVTGVAPSPVPAVQAQLESLAELGSTWLATLGVALENPLVGVGGGGLADILPARQVELASSVSFARNEALQLLVDFGLPVGLCVLLGVLTAFAGVRMRWHSEDAPAVVPITAGLWTLGAASLVDFALRIPAIGIAAALLAGALAAQVRRYRRRFTHYQRAPRILDRLARALPAAPALALLGVLVVAGAVVGVRLDLDAQRARRALYEPASATALADALAVELDARASAVLSLRPGYGRAYSVTGARFLEAGTTPSYGEHALDWLTRAHQLLPTDPPTLLALGLAQLATGATEAGISSLREAVVLDPSLRGRAASEVVRRHDVRAVWRAVGDALLEAAPAAGESHPVLTALLEADRPLAALSLANDRLRLDSDDQGALAGAARAALALHLDDLAVHFASALLERDPASAAGNLVVAETERRSGAYAQSVARLEALLETHPDDSEAWLALGVSLVGLAESRGVDAPLEETMGRVRSSLRERMMVDGAMAVEYHWLSARYFLLTEQWRAAESAARRAIEVAPERPELHRLLARALDGLEDDEGAMAARERANELAGARQPRGAE